MPTYIAILARESRVREIEAYRYRGIETTGIEIEHYTPGYVITVWQTEDADLAQQQADRLGSGLFGARVLWGENELAAYRAEVAPE